MNLKNLHQESKPVQTHVLFNPTQVMISIQIAKNEQLKEHITKVPAILICISGNSVYEDENGSSIELKNGDYVSISPNVKHWINALEESNFILTK